MEPMTRSELFMATAAGEYSGELPEPVTRSEFYWQKIAQRIDAGGGVSPESIDAAIEDYINTHDADIVTEAELSNALAGKQAVLTAGENIAIVDNNGNLTISATDTTYSAATTSIAGLMSATDKSKLDGIAAGAQVNTVTGVKGSNEAEYRTGNISITKGNVGLGNVDNTADADKPISAAAQTALDGKVDKITGKGLSEANFTDAEKTKLAGIAAGAEVNVQSDWNQGDNAADDYIRNKPANLVQDASYVHTDNNFTNAEKAKADGAIQSTEKGVANGVAELNANGKVPTSQLPAYVDDVLSYNSLSDFPATGEDGKIYIAKDTNLSYRWGSSEYVVISPSLALGSTSSTAYRGDWGAEDRAAIGTLSTLNTTEKSNLVGAINELKTASDAKQGTLDFDSAPTSGSTNPVTSGGVYTALAGKADATATQTALAGKADANHNHSGVYAPASHTHTKSQITDLANASASAAGLMSAADFKKINAQPIAANSDLNDLKYEGGYYCSASNTAATLSHCPTRLAFYMEVHKYPGPCVYQRLVEYPSEGAKHFHRNFYNNVWGNWVKWKLTDTTYSNAIPSTNGVGGSAGLMSAADKTKLNACKKIVYLASEAAYEALNPPDPDTVYMILE